MERVSAPIRDFTSADYDNSIKSLDKLIGRIEKLIKSLNKQDPDLSDIESAYEKMIEARDIIEFNYELIEEIDTESKE